MKISITLVTFFSLLGVSFAQANELALSKINRNKVEHTQDFSLMKYTINDNGDTILISGLKPVEIISLRVFTKQKEQKRYDKLVANIKRVYPYAQKAHILLLETETETKNMSKRDRKTYMKKVEEDLEAQFGNEIKRLNREQGRILLKLIDRQTGQNSYKLVVDLRGIFRAWFYNGMAGLFGYNLKAKFDPQNNIEDKYLDEIVKMIEAGTI